MSEIPAAGVRFKPHSSQRQKKVKAIQQDKFHKVIGNRLEGQGYADKRKRKVINQYRRERKKLLQGSSDSSSVSEAASSTAPSKPATSKRVDQRSKFKVRSQESTQKFEHNRKLQSGERPKHKRQQQETNKNRFWQAEQVHKHKVAEKQKKREDYLERQAKQEEALKRYKEKKTARHKKQRQKTPRGQPVMRYQIEHLLQKLKNE
ncbi:uncharacterized protein [Amphiura filiformis]|uniref:uncharacterized protein n=1 Tax=Amphiura filiformis TaxID=82378 RepID=UPI003B226DD5